jgi:hypothetical protein
MRQTTLMLVLVSALLACALAWAAPSPEAAAKSKADADAATKQAETMRANAEKATGDVKTEMLAIADAQTALATAQQKLSEAQAAGDNTVNDAKTAVAKADEWVKRLQDRLKIRQSQAQLTVSDQQLAGLQKSTAPANKPLLEAMLAAKAKTVTAGHTFANAITADATRDSIEVARDAWLQAIDESDLAARAFDLAQIRAQLAARPGGTAADAVAKLAEMEKADNALLAALKASKEATLALRLAERKHNTLFREADAGIARTKAK